MSREVISLLVEHGVKFNPPTRNADGSEVWTLAGEPDIQSIVNAVLAVERHAYARCEKKAHAMAAEFDRRGHLLKGRAVRELEAAIRSMSK